jgi:hypothetical protein
MFALAGAALAAAALATGCGGGAKPAETAPSGGGASEAEPAAGGDMVPPDKVEEVRKALQRKRAIVSRCLAIAIDNKELPKNSAGKVTLEIVIAPTGRASSVKIVRATVESKMLSDCVIGHVQEIQFPELPRQFETSFTYGFEAM